MNLFDLTQAFQCGKHELWCRTIEEMSPCTLYNGRHTAGAERVHNKIFYLELGTRKGWEQPLPLRSARGTASPAELILHKDAIVG